MTRVFVDAGHYGKDAGVVVGRLYENALAMAVRDKVKTRLIGQDAYFVPDDLDLKQSIQWVNERATPEEFAVSVHLNSNTNPNIRGTEAYYASTPRYAEVFAQKVSEYLQVPNRGPKPDSATWVGSLGWLRKLKCPSVVVELCYLTNEQDRAKIEGEGGLDAAAQGIVAAINALFPPIAPPLPIAFLLALRDFLNKVAEWLKGRSNQ